MTVAQREPHYSAALLNPEAALDRNRDLTSLGISSAADDAQALSLAKSQGVDWLHSNGVHYAILHVVRDGHCFHSHPLPAA